MARSSDPTKVAAWRGRFRRFARSGLAVARFCAKERVSVASFYYWRKNLGPQGRPQRRPQPVPECDDAFQQVTVVSAAVTVHGFPVVISWSRGLVPSDKKWHDSLGP